MKKRFTFLMAAVMLLTMIGLPGKTVGQTYKRISAVSDLSDGDQIIFVNQDETYACGTQQNNNNRTPVKISVSDHEYSYLSTDNVQVFTVKKNNSGEFGFHTGSGYLYSKSNSNNYLGTNTTAATTAPSGTAAWSLSVSSSVFSCTNVSNTSYYLAFNSTSYFSQYKSGQSKPFIYERAYTVTYNAGGGTGTMTDSGSPYTSGETVSVMANTFTRDGFAFSGWLVKDESDNEITVTEGDFTMPRGNVTVTAQWTPATTDPYLDVDNVDLLATATTGTIAYKVNNSVSGGKISAACTVGDSWISSVTVTDEDSDENTVTFSTSVNTEGERVGTIRLTYTYDSDKTKTADVTITQAAAQYTVTYQANGGTGDDVVKFYDYGTNVTVLAYNDEAIGFTAPSGKSFKNWKENSDTYDAGATISSISTNHTLAAQWEDIPTFYLVTNTNQIVTGKHYVIVSSNEEGSAYGIGAPNGTYRDRTSVTISKDSENKLYVLKTGSLSDFVLSGPDTDNKWTIYDQNNSVYLYGGSKGTLGGSSNIPNTAEWTIGITDDGDVEFNNNDFLIEYNASASRFASYAGTMGKVYLYIKDGDNDCHIYSTTDISNNMTVTGDMNIHEAGWVTVKNGASLTVEGTIINLADNDLVIEDGGQLIHTSPVNATLQKEVSAYSNATGAGNTDGWYFIASPLDGFATSNLALITADLYSFDEEAGMWWNAKNEETGSHPFTALSINQGYLYANSAVQTLEFAGNMQATNKEITIKLNKKAADGRAGQGVNLVGNPFTRSLNFGEVTIGGSDLTSYYIVEGGTEIEPVTFNASTPIKPGRGFMVEASADQEALVLNPSAKGRATVEPAYISIEAGNESFMDRAYVQIGEGNTLRKMTINNNVSHVYVQQADGDYAAATIEAAEGVIPVAFDAAADGTYTITVNVKGLETEYLHLVDNMTGADVDLLVNPSYTFNARNNDYESRFKLVFSSSNTDEAEAQSDFAFISNGNLIVAGTGTLQIVDMMGRTIGSYSTSDLISTSDLAQGVYVLRLVNGDNVKTQKIVVK